MAISAKQRAQDETRLRNYAGNLRMIAEHLEGYEHVAESGGGPGPRGMFMFPVEGVCFYDGTTSTEFELWEGAVERMMPGCFDSAIKNDDVRCLWNHDASKVLGRTKSGTLRLKVTRRGLEYEIDPSDLSYYHDLRESISRGDVTGSSFAFRATDETWARDGGKHVREIRGVQLFDVSPVTYPAYDGTAAWLRDAKRAMDAATRRAMVQAEQASLSLRIQKAKMA